MFGRPSRLVWLGASVGISGPSRATRVRGDEWLPREVTGKRTAMGGGLFWSPEDIVLDRRSE